MTNYDRIIEAMARALEPFGDEALGDYGSGAWSGMEAAEAALDAALPLILNALAEKVRGEKSSSRHPSGNEGLEYAAQLIKEGLD